MSNYATQLKNKAQKAVDSILNSQPHVILNNGVKMPSIALGTAPLHEQDRQNAQQWIGTALEVGYRHFDTAYDYFTEPALGRAIRASGIPREELFLTTKLPMYHSRVEVVAESYEKSLKNAGIEYYDLWLMHWPQATLCENDRQARYPEGHPKAGHFILDDGVTFNETWAEMEKLYKAGKVRAIGVSNFSVKNLKKLLETATVIPAVNQIECHPHQIQEDTVRFCKEKGIIITAYAVTGYSDVSNDPTVVAVAKKHEVSPAQVCIAWALARGLTAVPKTSDKDHQRADLFELPTLSTEEIDLINTLHRDAHYPNYPDPSRWLDGKKIAYGWTYEQMGW